MNKYWINRWRVLRNVKFLFDYFTCPNFPLLNNLECNIKIPINISHRSVNRFHIVTTRITLADCTSSSYNWHDILVLTMLTFNTTNVNNNNSCDSGHHRTTCSNRTGRSKSMAISVRHPTCAVRFTIVYPLTTLNLLPISGQCMCPYRAYLALFVRKKIRFNMLCFGKVNIEIKRIRTNSFIRVKCFPANPEMNFE